MMETVEEIVELSILFDFYGELLGEHKKSIFEDYVLNDLSLAEIADDKGISRQGVHDIIRRCTKQLHYYEEKLHLVAKFKETKQKVSSIQDLIRNAQQNVSRFYDIEQPDKIQNHSETLKKLEDAIQLSEVLLQDL